MVRNFDWKDFTEDYRLMDRRCKHAIRAEVQSERRTFRMRNESMLHRISVFIAILSIVLTVIFGCTCGRSIDDQTSCLIRILELATGILILYSIAVVVLEESMMEDDHTSWLIGRMTAGEGWTREEISDMLDIDGMISLDCLQISSEKMRWHMHVIGWGTLATMIAFLMMEICLI